MIAIADTSFVLAVGNRDDNRHRQCISLFRTHKRIILPQSVLAEVGYMLGSKGGNQLLVHFLYFRTFASVWRFVSEQGV